MHRFQTSLRNLLSVCSETLHHCLRCVFIWAKIQMIVVAEADKARRRASAEPLIFWPWWMGWRWRQRRLMPIALLEASTYLDVCHFNQVDGRPNHVGPCLCWWQQLQCYCLISTVGQRPRTRRCDNVCLKAQMQCVQRAERSGLKEHYSALQSRHLQAQTKSIRSNCVINRHSKVKSITTPPRSCGMQTCGERESAHPGSADRGSSLSCF
mmetsp:Transcript_56715/g.93805  ORF Transcript_56715/g.93805 Transcript_56715/m.93805 type:complete len:210 (-) Transcript_56715:25-654(-)